VRHRGRLLVAADTELLALAAEVRPGEAPVLVRTGFNVPTWSFAQIGEELFVASLEGIQRLADPSAPPGAFRFEMLAQARFAYSVLADRTAPRVFGLTDRGLHLIERVGDRWIARDVRFAAVSGELRWLAQEGGGALWVGSTNGRALRIEPVDAGWSDVRVETFDAASGLPPGAARVFSFRGGAIVGTSHGPFVLDASSRGLVPDTRLKDLPHDASGELEWLEFTEMANGEVWARIGAQSGRARPTASGYRWDPAALAPVASEPVYDFHRDADGATWIGRSKSLVRLAPDAPSAAALPAPRLRAIRDGTGALLAQDRALEQPTLAAGLADLRFEFAWPAYALAEGARFRSRLDGHERDFSPWTPEPHRDVGGLRGGRYVLHLETMDRYGRVRSAQPHAFELPPPWYRTWWALLAWIAVGVACLAIVVWQATRWRTRRLELARASLERVVEERTAQVRNQAERLEALDLAKSGFFAGVTHEFRTPLTLILEPLRELREGMWGKLPARTATALDHIERNAQRVLALVNQLLDLQSAEAGTLRIAPKAGDLAVLTRAVAGAFEGVAARAGLTFEVQASQPAPARFDPIHMESVVANLVSNALKYTPAGGRVLVEVSPDDAGARLVVANSGPGIPAEELPRIFERFYRAPPRLGEHARGAGLGLAVVKEIVERHGGTVNATSEPGQGAEFEVVLPAVPASEAETGEAFAPGATTLGAVAALPDAPHASDGTVDAGDATTVLLVDDNVELREFLAQRLQLDYRVLQAGDGEAALSAARAHLPDVVVSDVNMPRMDGIALLRALKADPATSAIGVVLLASGATVEARAEGFSIGADDYIYKPFNTTELLARIAGLIASRTQLRKALVEAVSGGEHEAPPEDPLIARVRAAVHARLDDSAFGVAELAAELHMERTTLFKRLKALGAPAPVKLMRDIRLEAAARMLREAAGQVTEVAYACGYQSLSHFSSSFSEKFGVRPSEYLQRARSRVPE
jgi:signal transduction histidine kinase/DNA-binding response OmpR family regulator